MVMINAILTEPERNFLRFITESLISQLSHLTKEIDGVRCSDDPEYVHRMRVSSRRLRTRLAIFGNYLPDKKAVQWRKKIRNVTKSLGAARDTDVQIIFIKQVLDTIENRRLKEGVRRLHLRLLQRRSMLQKSVIRTLSRLEPSGVITDMEETLRNILAGFVLDEKQAASGLVFTTARDEISAKLSEMLSFEMYINDPARVAELHMMRIAAKHLRYSMEVFEPLFRTKFKKPLSTVKNIQEMLGDIHDCDVWVEFLPDFLEEEKALAIQYVGHAKNIGRLKKGIKFVEEERSNFRKQRYVDFLRYWKENIVVWTELMTTLNKVAGTKP